MSDLVGWLMILGWLAGVVIAHGFASTFCAVIFPPYGWYLTGEALMRHAGFI